jgi:hypothetical protein
MAHKKREKYTEPEGSIIYSKEQTEYPSKLLKGLCFLFWVINPDPSMRGFGSSL